MVELRREGERDGLVIHKIPGASWVRRGVVTREKHSERILFWKRRPGLAASTDLRGAGVVPLAGAVAASPEMAVEGGSAGGGGGSPEAPAAWSRG